MKTLAIKTLVNAVALWVAAIVVPGVRLGEENPSLATRIVSILLVAVLFGLVNAVLKPLVKLLSWPAIMLTLGLFTIVVNAFMLQVTSWLARPLDLDFHVDSFFWAAIAGALVISLVSMVLHVLIPDHGERHVV